MICKGCKAVEGGRHPNDITDFTNAKCGLGYQTMRDGTMMMPVHKCEKPKSWKALERLKREQAGR